MVKQLQILGQQPSSYSKAIPGIQRWQEKIGNPFGADMLKIFNGGKSHHLTKETKQEVKDLLIQGGGKARNRSRSNPQLFLLFLAF